MINVVRECPLIAGLLCVDPTRDMQRFLEKVAAAGYDGVMNCPTVALIDGKFRSDFEETAAAPASPSTEETTSQQVGARGNDRDQHQLLECLRCNFIAHMLSDVHAEHDWQHRSRRD